MAITRRLVVAGVALGLLVAGCSDDDGETVEANDSAATTDDGGGGAATDDDGGAQTALPEDPCALLGADEIQFLIGPNTSEQESGTSVDGAGFTQCVWETEDHGPRVGVAVVEGRERYDQRVGFVEDGEFDGEMVDDLGDGAVVIPGVSLETTGGTGGRTATVLVGDQTVAVAVKLDGETSVQDVVTTTESVLGRL